MSHIPYRYLLPAMLALTGCASVDIDQSTQNINQHYAGFTQGHLQLAQQPNQRAEMQARAQALLQQAFSQTLSQEQAVEIALLNSPSLQALLASHLSYAANTAQEARISNPLFNFERSRQGEELEIGRLLSIGLLDILSLPQRQKMAQYGLAQTQIQMSMAVIERVSQVRMAWVKAVAAQQSLEYAAQVSEAAEASAELAERMRKAGNFNTLQAARQQAFQADAAAQLSLARHATLASREVLVRLLGLSDEQEKILRLPARLPDLPDALRPAEKLGTQATRQRLDIRLAQQEFDAAAARQGLSLVSSFTDIELGIRRNTIFDGAGKAEIKRGVEISLSLPVFDWGDNKRAAMNATTLAASYQLQDAVNNAGSQLRVSYSAYQTTYQIARQYRDDILPLRKRISNENQLRYNGMFISVFELLADTREQINSVMAAINAEQQFWLADAALQAELVGKPVSNAVSMNKSVSTAEATH